MILSGEWLRVIKENALLPLGEVVYCIVDEGFQFRVRTSKEFQGVTEFIFMESSKEKFVVLD